MNELFRDGKTATFFFCDGACSGNPGPGGWGTVVVTDDGHVTELGGGERETTNNRMELVAAIRGLEHLRAKAGEVHVFTDSVYVIRGITQWIFGWKRRGWKTAEGADVANRETWEKLLAVVTARGPKSIFWHFVRGHSGVAGNERCDAIAVAFSKRQTPDLYDGPLLRYGVAITDVPANTDLPEMKPKEAKAKAYSYLSFLDGVAQRHATWPECEKRVKGRSGARFKKAMSADEESEILASWGASL